MSHPMTSYANHYMDHYYVVWCEQKQIWYKLNYLYTRAVVNPHRIHTLNPITMRHIKSIIKRQELYSYIHTWQTT